MPNAETQVETQEDQLREYRTLYWDLNELQLLRPDCPDPKYCDQLIREAEAAMRNLERSLGFVPEA